MNKVKVDKIDNVSKLHHYLVDLLKKQYPDENSHYVQVFVNYSGGEWNAAIGLYVGNDARDKKMCIMDKIVRSEQNIKHLVKLALEEIYEIRSQLSNISDMKLDLDTPGLE